MTAPEAWHVTRTMRAMQLLAIAPRSAPELADGLGIDPRTARRILNRLQDDGYVELKPGDRRRRYRPTMMIVALAGQVVARADLTQTALPHVEGLQRELGEDCHLCVPSYRSALCLVHATGNHPNGCRPHLRELVPCHATAAGKALLAWRTAWRETVISSPLERFTERTITGSEWLRRELTRTTVRGYAIEDREYHAETRALAAPVVSDSGQVVAALAVVATSTRLPLEQFMSTGQAVASAAAGLSAELGASRPETPAFAGHRSLE